MGNIKKEFGYFIFDISILYILYWGVSINVWGVSYFYVN